MAINASGFSPIRHPPPIYVVIFPRGHLLATYANPFCTPALAGLAVSANETVTPSHQRGGPVFITEIALG
jgi:hypothetical protein